MVQKIEFESKKKKKLIVRVQIKLTVQVLCVYANRFVCVCVLCARAHVVLLNHLTQLNHHYPASSFSHLAGTMAKSASKQPRAEKKPVDGKAKKLKMAKGSTDTVHFPEVTYTVPATPKMAEVTSTVLATPPRGVPRVTPPATPPRGVPRVSPPASAVKAVKTMPLGQPKAAKAHGTAPVAKPSGTAVSKAPKPVSRAPSAAPGAATGLGKSGLAGGKLSARGITLSQLSASCSPPQVASLPVFDVQDDATEAESVVEVESDNEMPSAVPLAWPGLASRAETNATEEEDAEEEIIKIDSDTEHEDHATPDAITLPAGTAVGNDLSVAAVALPLSSLCPRVVLSNLYPLMQNPGTTLKIADLEDSFAFPHLGGDALELPAQCLDPYKALAQICHAVAGTDEVGKVSAADFAAHFGLTLPQLALPKPPIGLLPSHRASATGGTRAKPSSGGASGPRAGLGAASVSSEESSDASSVAASESSGDSDTSSDASTVVEEPPKTQYSAVMDAVRDAKCISNSKTADAQWDKKPWKQILTKAVKTHPALAYKFASGPKQAHLRIAKKIKAGHEHRVVCGHCKKFMSKPYQKNGGREPHVFCACSYCVYSNSRVCAPSFSYASLNPLSLPTFHTTLAPPPNP
jgi:hypothetical protein